ncbi:rod shape-determining protein MreC [Intestinibaculum porci]|nr:rod shape-determining protein MreC [Intestinibaculum porci]
MFNKKDKRSQRMFWITIVLVAASVISLLTSTNNIPGSGIVRDTVANVEYYVIKAPLNYVRGVLGEYNELKEVYRENKRLKRSLDNYARELALNNVLADELQEMRSITKIKSLPTDYKVKYTTVIKRDSENWDNKVIIDIGSGSNVKKGMAVITSKGMIGIVSSVNRVSSTVTLLTSEDRSVQLPVMIKSNGKYYYGLLNDYNVESQTYKVQMLSTVNKLKVGSSVTTSGLGGKGKTPKGILVGTVKGLSNNASATGKTVTVKPSVDFDDLSYVAVVQRSNA